VLDKQWQIPGDSGAGCHPQEEHGDLYFPGIKNRLQPGSKPFGVMVAKQFFQIVGVHVYEGSGASSEISLR